MSPDTLRRVREVEKPGRVFKRASESSSREPGEDRSDRRVRNRLRSAALLSERGPNEVFREAARVGQGNQEAALFTLSQCLLGFRRHYASP